MTYETEFNLIARMKILSCCIVALFSSPLLHAGAPSPVTQQQSSSEWDFSVGQYTGWRQDHFEWTIAGDTSGSNPNILSDLDWRHLDIVSVNGQAEVTFRKDWHFRLGGGYGWIVSGDNRDSDYDFDDRRGEFSRSTASTRGSLVNADAALAFDFQISPRVTLTPSVGFTYHRLRVNDRHGVQVVDTEFHDLGPFDGLDSTYTANWWGPTFGLDTTVKLTEKWRWLAGVRYELLRYRGNGHWNLRPDINDFHDTARGDGWLLTTGVEWDFAQHWTLAVLGDYGHRRTRAGSSDTELSDHSHIKTRFNGAQWESLGARVMVTYCF